MKPKTIPEFVTNVPKQYFKKRVNNTPMLIFLPNANKFQITEGIYCYGKGKPVSQPVSKKRLQD